MCNLGAIILLKYVIKFSLVVDPSSCIEPSYSYYIKNISL
jgi:hypothetical protein